MERYTARTLTTTVPAAVVEAGWLRCDACSQAVASVRDGDTLVELVERAREHQEHCPGPLDARLADLIRQWAQGVST